MGSILGALSRANATLGSAAAAGAKLAVWECEELSHGLSARLWIFLTSAVDLQEQKKGRRNQGGEGVVISQQCQKSQPRPCLSIEASLGRTMDFPAI